MLAVQLIRNLILCYHIVLRTITQIVQNGIIWLRLVLFVSALQVIRARYSNISHMTKSSKNFKYKKADREIRSLLGRIHILILLTNGCIKTSSTAIANQNPPYNSSIVVTLQLKRWKTKPLKVKYMIGSMTSSKPFSLTDQNSTTSFTQREGTLKRSRPGLLIWVSPIMMNESRFLGNPQTLAIISTRNFRWLSKRGDPIAPRYLLLTCWKTPQALLCHLRRYLNKSWISSWLKSRSSKDLASRKT